MHCKESEPTSEKRERKQQKQPMAWRTFPALAGAASQAEGPCHLSLGFLCSPWGVGSPQPATTRPEECGMLEGTAETTGDLAVGTHTVVTTKWHL